MHDRHGQFLSAASVGDHAVLRGCVELPIDLGAVEALGMTDIRETELVLLGPEEWNSVEPLSSSKDVAGRGVTLAFGQHPVLE